MRAKVKRCVQNKESESEKDVKAGKLKTRIMGVCELKKDAWLATKHAVEGRFSLPKTVMQQGRSCAEIRSMSSHVESGHGQQRTLLGMHEENDKK